MSEPKRVRDKFRWVPMHERVGRFGFPLSQKVDPRRPLLWLAREGRALFLVNDSGGALDRVTVWCVGISFEGEDGPVRVVDERLGYEDVEPGEAVEVYEFHPVYDSDPVFQVHVRVASARFGDIEFSTPPYKGGIGETVLMWDTGELGKLVLMTRL